MLSYHEEIVKYNKDIGILENQIRNFEFLTNNNFINYINNDNNDNNENDKNFKVIIYYLLN